MLIDPISIHFSGNVANCVVSNPTQLRFISAFKNLLTSVGWTLVKPLYAATGIGIPLLAPASSGVDVSPKRVINCPAGNFLHVGGSGFNFYDAYSEIPGPGSCIWVQTALSGLGSLANLATKIAAMTDFGAEVLPDGSGGAILQVTAKLPGPEFNDVLIYSDYHGYVAYGVRTAGGGYRLRSAPGASVYEVSLTWEPNPYDGYLIFRFFLDNSATVECRLLYSDQGTTIWPYNQLGTGDVDQYTIIANPYGFAIFDAPHDPGYGYARKISLFAMAPYIPSNEVPSTEQFVSAYAVFIVWPNGIGGEPRWSDGSTMCLDGPSYNTWADDPSARVLALCSPGAHPLLTPSGVPLITGAYVMFGQSMGSDAWIVGKLWDCALVTDFVDEGATISDKRFLTLGYCDGSNNRTRCTLLMTAGETAGDAALVVAPPGPPPPLPLPSFKGTVNLFGDGVTWLDGDLFVPELVGRSITIGGEPYLIASVADPKHLTLTSAKVVTGGTGYTVP